MTRYKLILGLILAIFEFHNGYCRMTGFSRGSSSGGYRPSAPSPPRSSSSSSSSGRQGWSRPSQPTQGWTRPMSNTNSRPSSSQNSQPTQHASPQTHSSNGPPYGWQKSPSPPVTQKPAPQTHSSNPSYGWQTPRPIATQTQKPVQHSSSQTHSDNGPPPPPYVGQKSPSPPVTQKPVQHPSPQTHSSNPSYGWHNPTPRPIATQTQKPSSYNNRPSPYHPNSPPSDGSQINGKKYEKGFSNGYDQGYQRGLKQGARVPPAYYPPQNQFGYPGQGITSGYGSPTYGGMSVFGSNHNYGYPTNNAYSYPTYGTGSSGGLGTGILLGAIGGYALHSVLHPFSYSTLHSASPSLASNPWGYSGTGYGSDYHYTRVDNRVINNYYFNQTTTTTTDSETKSNGENNGWIHCVAYDPMSATTYLNPNCTCNLTLERDSTTNESVAVHHCYSSSGLHVERTPVSEVETLDEIEGSKKHPRPERIELEIDERRNQIFREIEKLVDMGRFTSSI